MTQREKVLATSLVVLVGVLGSAVVLFLFVLEPLKQVKDRLDMAKGALEEKNRELQAEQEKVEDLLNLNPRLGLWQDLSLSPRDPSWKKGTKPTDEQKKKHTTRLQVDYERFLRELMRRHSFRDASVTPRQTEQRNVAAQRGKQPLFEPLAFGVAGKASLANTVKMLQEFHETNLMHMVRNLSVDLVSTTGGRGQTVPAGTLEVKMTVEALMINGARDRASLIPSVPFKPRILAEPKRDYALLDTKNMFTGVRPPSGVDRKLTEEKQAVLRFVKLTMLWRDTDSERWQATLYDQAKGGSEMKLSKSPSWRAKFTILDKYEETVLQGQVVYVDEKQLIFKADGKHYRLRVGDFVYPAVRTPVPEAELREVGVEVESPISAPEGESDQ
jgi:hypothetical protein